MAFIPLFTGVIPAEGLTDGLNTLINLINANFVNTSIPPVPVGSAYTVGPGTVSGSVFALNTAGGSTLTLPPATGSGARYRVLVTTTTISGAHKVLAASSADFINGIAYGFNGSTAKVFASAAATNHSIQMPFTGSQPSGGFIGDWFEITDVAANLWEISGFYQAGTTPTTPYSSATS